MAGHLMWMSKGYDRIHWWVNNAPVCSGATHNAWGRVGMPTCGDCIRIVEQIPDLEDPVEVERWLSA